MPPRGESWLYALDEPRATRLLNHCKELEESAVLKSAMYAGLRADEFAHLKAEWIRAGEINIPARSDCERCTKCLRRGSYWQPKSKAGVRTIYVVAPLQGDLFEYLRLHPEGFGRLRQEVWRIVNRVAKRAGMDGEVFPHSLRATCATFLARTMNATQLAYVMGWSSIELAQHYVDNAHAKVHASQVMKNMYGS